MVWYYVYINAAAKFLQLCPILCNTLHRLLCPWNSPGKNTDELYKKYLHDPDNQDGMITHQEPDILECEVKWTITTNKASGGDGIPVELFQILKDDAVKVLHSVCQEI